MNKKNTVVFSLLLACAASTAGTDAAGPAPEKAPAPAGTVIVVPVEGTVNAAMAAFIGRAIKESRKYPNRALVLELDTYGGEVDAAFRIVDTMLTLRDCPTIAYVKTKAISAGALIALSCKKLYMQSHTTLGDVAPLISSQEGPTMLGEKFQAPIRAKFRILAKQNGYPQRLTEAMVTSGMAVYEVKLPDTTLFLDSTEIADLAPAKKSAIISRHTAVKSGELLTMDDLEAKSLRFSQMTVSNFDEMLQQTGLAGAEVIRYRESWSEKFVKIIGFLAPVLMTVGLGLLYLEFKHPGFGLPGIAGIICIGLVLFGQYMVGLANYTEILLVIVGIILIGVELFLFPTMGLILVVGVALMLIGLVVSLQGFVLPRPDLPWQQHILIKNLATVLGSFIVAGVLSFLAVRFLLPGVSKVVKGPYLDTTLGDAKVDFNLRLPVAVGDSGVVSTMLRPAGRAKIKGEEYDVVADGEYIEKGAPVKISIIDGTRIVVVREGKAA